MDQRWVPALLLVLIVHQGVSGPLIEPQNGTLTKKKGDRISLGCTDLPGVRWITPSSAKKAVNQSHVNIKSAEPKHTGRYVCQNLISFENSSLYIFVEDSKNLFVNPSLRQMFIGGTEGAEAVIPCRVTTPMIKNLRLEKVKGTPMPKDLSYTADIYTGISITNLKRHFEGYYVCTAVLNGIVKKSARFKLQIIPVPKRAPEITVKINKELLKEGEEFQMTCTIKNINHAVTVNWIHPQSSAAKVTTSSNNFPNYYQTIRTLCIDSVTVNDTGSFTCFARNDFGVSNATVFLQVIAEGYIKLLPPESSVLHVNIGENLVLNVEFDAYPAPDQQYWIHMNETLLNTSDHFIKSAKVGNRYISELHLVRVKGTEGGIYTFFASNSDSNSSVSFDVHINSSPEIITIEEPKPGHVRCVAIGFPKPKIKWLNCPGPQKRCSDTPMATAEELHWTNRIIRQPHFGRIEVESILNTKELNSNITVECLSSNSVGENHAIYQMKEGIPKTHHLFTPLLTLFAAAAGLLCVILVILFYKYQQKPRYQIQWKVVEGIHGNNYTYIDPTQLPYDDKWEFPRDKLRFGKTLGAGAFGKVVEASVYGLTKADSIITVAVKMLKPSAHSTEKEALMSELKVLSHLGQHINIVNLLGACTIGGPVLVITEYCCFGDLLNFLRRKRDSFIWPENGEQNLEKTQYKNIPNLSNGSGSYMEMKPSSISSPQKNVDKRKPLRKESYSDKENNNEVTEEYNLALEIEDLLIFSYQVAKGMNFLSSKNCIHRDLAARNILLTNGQIAKICDFGLARDIRNDSNYVVKGNARLPVKWMAPESIFDCVYTFESDVWSYGILLWEIFSLGSSPYPGIPVDNKFYKMIKEGYRMLSPELASTELYEVMKACWDSDALRRPTFAQVVGMIEEQLSDTSKHYSNLESNFTSRLKFSSHSSRLNSAGSSNASDQPLLMNDDVFFEDENKQMQN
ncbi:mast/stem cell growth factor receptor Kit-like isoform X2 [Carcharodon carcharias]|uniref:mast/stem cell growth factor receptor Kit-like isoform X2 n=1 Tax=Carcharodon carcharias TaxID=13397 RepID=UPI001B7E7225|nr:mast/stem cell growth factor receptor Kit-like isoform X2 [Carcharodon carcharias]